MMVSNTPTTVVVTTALAVISTSFLAYVWIKNRKKEKVPTEWKQIGNVEKLYLFPLKSGKFVEIDMAECTEIGFRLMKTEDNPLQLRDRSFIVYGEQDKEIKSGRGIPSIVKIETLIHDATHIALNAPNMQKTIVEIPRKNYSNLTVVKDWCGDYIETLDCGDEVAKWLSHYIAQKDSGYRLGYDEGTNRRKFIKRLKKLQFYKNLTNDSMGLYSDLTSAMIVNHASVDDCAYKISTEKITPLHFRGNIVVGGPDLNPFDEDNWDFIKVGDVIMRNVKECTRCAFTNVDPQTGKRSMQKEPINTLLRYRKSRGPENAAVMGVHMDIKKTGVIKHGDPVFVGCD